MWEEDGQINKKNIVSETIMMKRFYVEEKLHKLGSIMRILKITINIKKNYVKRRI